MDVILQTVVHDVSHPLNNPLRVRQVERLRSHQQRVKQYQDLYGTRAGSGEKNGGGKGAVVDRSDFPPDSAETEFPEAVRELACESLDVDEIWDYAWRNIDFCARWGKRPPKMRFVPPGWDEDVPREEGKDVVSRHPVLFLGQIFKSRRQCFQTLQQQVFPSGENKIGFPTPSLLQVADAAYNETAYRKQIAGKGFFVNFHKTGCFDNENYGLEVFRVAKLLSWGKIVLSTPCFAPDMAEWGEVVDFGRVEGGRTAATGRGKLVVGGVSLAPHEEDSGHVRNRLEEGRSPLLSEIWKRWSAASDEEIQAEAQRRFEVFREKFHPSAIFQRAKIYD